MLQRAHTDRMDRSGHHQCQYPVSERGDRCHLPGCGSSCEWLLRYFRQCHTNGLTRWSVQSISTFAEQRLISWQSCRRECESYSSRSVSHTSTFLRRVRFPESNTSSGRPRRLETICSKDTQATTLRFGIGPSSTQLCLLPSLKRKWDKKVQATA